jgi:ArsR family transcriptional regulator
MYPNERGEKKHVMQKLTGIFKALSEETRLRIIKILEDGELCVCNIVAALEMVQPKISFHLSALKEAGFIRDRRQGKWTHYRLDDSDLFRRFLILSVIERIPADTAARDKKRLELFLRRKTVKGKVVSMNGKSRCCSR